MSVSAFVERQIAQIRLEGSAALLRKLKKAFLHAALSVPVVLFVIAIRLIRPLLLVRFCELPTDHIGFLAGITELHLCEKRAGINVPARRHLDLWYMPSHPICNVQLARMWRRVLRIWPAWFLAPVVTLNRLIPGGEAHEVGENTQGDRDVHNLLDGSPPHLRFTAAEEARGQAGMRAMGIPPGTQHVCLIARDHTYFPGQWPSHDPNSDTYRNCDIQNFCLAAEELADRGYFVIRMGARVREPMKITHPRILDYATNGMRSDFMDIYLGATCMFCVSSSTGFDAVPMIFRRPLVLVNMVPLAWIRASSKEFLSITKHHYSMRESRELTLSEIVSLGPQFFEVSGDYQAKGVKLIENTPQEIRDVAIEMAERLKGTWQPHAKDKVLQQRFWAIFPANAVDESSNRAIHGEIRGRFGAAFLRANRAWLH